MNNAGLIASGRDSVLVDTAATAERAGKLRAAVASTIGGPPKAVVNTHHHSDHTFGNFLFAENTVVVGHWLTRAETAATGLAIQGLWPEVDWGEISVRLPDVTFSEQLVLHAGELRVELHHLTTAHTTNDTVVWVPERKVLFAGDIVLSGVTPFCLMGSVEGSLRTIAWLRGFGAETVVCGHGPVASTAVLDENERYLRWIQRCSAGGMAAGLTPLELARELDLGEFADWLDPERLVANLHRGYAERHGSGVLGEPLDVRAVFGDMTQLNGGHPRCEA
ncbi:MBL fold metallo-hydrolase [Streptomyces sp. 769]|uniref:MBL fold metallo-hydrolase n=1 Tax=Streptomyces sp. 769 TaxID=1262452 RepID=UPI0031B5EBC9